MLIPLFFLPSPKIMPLKMSEVVAMNKEVVKYTPADDDAPRKCHGCNEVKEKLGKCGGCGLFFYCNTVSQVLIRHLHMATYFKSLPVSSY